ncbi:MAG: GNAT family N-acetyltransferase [Actinocatenispora sp.]
MRVHHDTSLTDFAERVLPWLERSPALNNIVIVMLASRLAGIDPVEPDAWWLRVHGDDGELRGVALRTPPRRPLLLSEMDDKAAVALADHCASEGLDVPEVTGPSEASTAFAERYGAARGTSGTAGMAQCIYVLDTVVPPPGVPGRLRAPDGEETELLVAWARQFHQEVDPGSAGDLGKIVRRRLQQPGLVWVWEESDRRPVAMNYVSRPVAGVVRVSAVYTPPELRGRGYASAMVAATSQRALDAGAERCLLYADLSNPISNRLYQRVGYRPARDVRAWAFDT